MGLIGESVVTRLYKTLGRSEKIAVTADLLSVLRHMWIVVLYICIDGSYRLVAAGE
jgi:hypothetical protein